MNNVIKAGLLAMPWLWIACATAAPLEPSRYNDTLYFADDQSTNILRYSLASKTFLTSISLAQTPKAIHVDAQGIYISYGTSIVKLDLAGATATNLRTTSQEIYDIESTNDYLMLSGYSYLQVVNKTTSTLVDSKSLWYSSTNISLSSDGRHIFATSAGISPADIYKIELAADGKIGNAAESPYHGDYNIGDHAQAFPSQSRVVDSSGNVYNTSNLTHAGSLGGSYSAIDFWQGLPIVLRDGKVYSYNQAMLETGVATLSLTQAHQLAVYEDQIFVFGPGDNTTLSVERFDVSAVTPADPVAPVDPSDMAYNPDAVALDKDGDTVYLLSKNQLNIFRWSISQQDYLPSLPLTNSPDQFAYSAKQARIYLSYSNGAINYVDLVTGKETPFANLGSYASALVAAGDNVVAKGQTGAWGSLSIYNSVGALTDYRDWIQPTNSLVWDASSSSLYFISRYSPSDLYRIPLDKTGKLGNESSSPYHDSIYWADPIRISETGKYIALATGRVMDDISLMEQANVYSNAYFTDLVWLKGNLFTLKGVDSDTYSQLERWQADFSINSSGSREFFGKPLALVAAPSLSKLIVIYQQNGKPQFDIMNVNEQDFDKDGVFDSQDLFPANANDSNDFDRDGKSDSSDSDDDNDGVLDINDSFPFNAKESLDSDKDGIGNSSDNDDDNDGVADDKDALPLNANESSDFDHDGIGDNSDPDKDNDGITNSDDAFPLSSIEWLDTDKDGIGNNSDYDDDNDGVTDDADFYPLNASKSVLQATEFLPLNKGSQWFYDAFSGAAILGADKKIAGQTINPISFPAGSKIYLKVVNNQIQFFGFYLPKFTTEYGTFSTDFMFNKGVNLLASGTHSGQGDIEISPKYGERKLNWEVYSDYMGTEAIEVPAGKFTAIHTRFYFTGTTTIDNTELQISYSSDYWFAENIGLVRIHELGYNIGLTSANITKPSTDSGTDNGGGSSGGGGGSSGGGGGGSIHWALLALLGACVITRKKVAPHIK